MEKQKCVLTQVTSALFIKPKITSLPQRAFIGATSRDLDAFYSLFWGIFQGNDATERQNVVMTNIQAVTAR